MTTEASRDEEIWLPAWDGARYAANNAHHRVHDAGYLSAFPVGPADRLLDLGCGSGEFTSTVAELVPEGHVVGLDAQPSMLEEARKRARPNQSFVLGPVQRLASLLPEDGSFDAVYTRAALQWVPGRDHPGVLANVFRLLKPGGWLRLEMGGAGNILRTLAFLDPISARYGGPSCPWYFPDPGTYLEMLEEAGFDVSRGFIRTVPQRRAFDREGLLGWFRSQAFEAYLYTLPEESHDAFKHEVESRVDEMRRPDGTYDLTYVRLDLLAYKPTQTTVDGTQKADGV